MAKEITPFLFADIEETINFWKDVCYGDFNVTEISGNHVTCAEKGKNANDLSKLLGDF